MSELSGAAKALLERSRLGLSPTADDQARVRARLLAKVAAAGAAGAAAAVAVHGAANVAKGALAKGAAGAGAGAAALGTTGAAAVLKAAVAVTMLSAVVVGTVATRDVWRSAAVSAPTVAVNATSQPKSPAPTVPTANAASTATVESPAAASATSIEVSPAARTTPTAIPAGASAPAVSATKKDAPREIEANTPAAATSVADETALLRDAHIALEAGNSARALALLAEHGRRFPRGMLGEERDATRVFALCAAGNATEARAAAARFLRERPSSPLAARVQQSCGAR